MAILTNRVKSTNYPLEFIKFILLILKRFLVLIFIVLSLYSLYFSNPQVKNNLSLEISGRFVATGLIAYENVLNYINFAIKKLVYLRDLEIENTELKIEVVKLKELQSNYHSLKTENIALKNLLQFVEKNEHKIITTKLLSVSLNPFSKSAVIGAGTKQGAEIDQMVVNHEGLVGRIIEVSNNYSKVMLIGDFSSRIPIVTSLSRERGILGGNSGKIQIMYLKDNHSVKKGEKVITSGDGKVYPEGIVVGEVVAATKEYVLVEPVVDLSNTDFVSIYTK